MTIRKNKSKKLCLVDSEARLTMFPVFMVGFFTKLAWMHLKTFAPLITAVFTDLTRLMNMQSQSNTKTHIL